jgi:hypothetical protein
LAERAPLAAGVKVKDTVQEAETAMLDPHVFDVIAKSPGFRPERLTLARVVVAVPLLVAVIVPADVTTPTFCDPKAQLVLLKLMAGTVGATPVPLII